MTKPIEPDIVPNVTMNVELDSRALVDIGVAQREEALLTKERQALAELHELEEKRSKLRKEYDETLEKLGDAAAEKMQKQIATPLKKAGFKNLKFRCSVVRVDDKNKRAKLSMRFHIHEQHNHNQGIRSSKKVPVPAKIKTLFTKVQNLDESLEKAKDHLMKIKTQLQNIPRMERRARAAMAIQALESTPQGRKMLDGIRKDALKALPAPE